MNTLSRHPEYREFLLDHLLDVALRHWDSIIRELGSQSLRLISLTDLQTLGPRACAKAVSSGYLVTFTVRLILQQARLLESIDVIDLHGGLLALSEVAIAYRDAKPTDGLDVRMRDVSITH